MLQNKITIEHREVLEEYLNAFDYRTSGLCFTSLHMWRAINHFSWQIIDDYLCISGYSHLTTDKEEPFLFPPLTKTGTYDPKKLKSTLLTVKEIFEKKGYPFSVRLIPFHMLDVFKSAFPNQLNYIADRPNYDYIYSTKDLIELKGRDFHPKKNHLNYFHNNYKYEYISLTSSMANECIAFIKEFNARKQLPDHEMQLLLMEEKAMFDVFQNIEKVGYLAGGIIIQDKLEAISIGGKLGNRMVCVHVEKANTEYRGLYQAINNEFCKAMASNIKCINREEDMDLPGLRKAKLSYNPIKLLEKYIITFK